MALYKRNKVWWISIIHNGKRIRKTTETSNKKLAEKIHAKVLTQIAEGKWFEVDENKEKTFAELADKYEAQEFRELKDWQKVQCYLNQLKKFFGSYPLSKINPALIDDFKQMRKAKGVKPATINRQLNILKRMLNLAEKRWMWVNKVPAIEMESRADTKRIRHLSFNDYHRLLDCCEDWLKGIVAVAAWTGLRQGNILDLKKSQINIAAEIITLDAPNMKNRENLIIPVSSPALKVLKQALKASHINSLYAFCDSNGVSHCARKVQRAFKKALNLADIEDFRFHDLRHCFASWNRQAGVDIDTLADLMGHKDTRMTKRYAHITPGHLKSAIRLLEESYSKCVTI